MKAEHSSHAHHTHINWYSCHKIQPLAPAIQFSIFTANQQHKWFDNQESIIDIDKKTPNKTHTDQKIKIVSDLTPYSISIRVSSLHRMGVITLKRMTWNVHISRDELFTKAISLYRMRFFVAWMYVSVCVFVCLCYSFFPVRFPFVSSFGTFQRLLFQSYFMFDFQKIYSN